MTLAHAAAPATAVAEAADIRSGADSLKPMAEAESARIRDAAETEGLLDVGAEDARAFLARLAEAPDAALTEKPLDLAHTLLAVYARNPGVAAARADWAASVRMYEQATYLGDVLLRYRALTSRSPGAMPEPAFAYPGQASLQGEMITAEAAMARERARMALLTAMVDAAKAFHGASHHAEEVAIRTEEAELAKRMVATAKSMVESGMKPQADLLDAESELAMATSTLGHAVSAGAAARAELNTLLARAPDAPFDLVDHIHPPDIAPEVGPLLDLARRYSPEIRMARAESDRSSAAIRLAEGMLFAAKPIGAVAMPAERPASAAAGQDLAWIEEMKERHAGLVRSADEAVRATERRVLAAQYELEAARRMASTAGQSTVPLAKQALDERVRLFEAGRASFADVLVAERRHLEARHDFIGARHDYGMAEAMVWMAVGARPEVAK
jgi:outer membrane protein TolC